MNITEISSHIFAGMADGILFVDKDHKIRLYNDQAAELGMQLHGDLVGKDFEKCHKKTTFPGVIKVFNQLRDKPGSVHTRLVHVNLSTHEINYSAVFGDYGDFLGVLAVSRDITDKVKMQKKLSKLSITDGLTGLFNHRHFYYTIKREMVRAKRYNKPLSLLLFDLDNFKQVNDTKGHAEGDKTLKKIGNVVKKNIRQHIDEAFRYGGDEFTIILPEADQGRAFNAAERLRKSVEQQKLDKVTLSIGIACYEPDMDPVTFVHKADESMYRAKKQGGNQICLYDGRCWS